MLKGPEGMQNKILWKVKRDYLSPETSEDGYSRSAIVLLCDRAPSTPSWKDWRLFFNLDLEHVYTGQTGEYVPALLSFTTKE